MPNDEVAVAASAPAGTVPPPTARVGTVRPGGRAARVRAAVLTAVLGQLAQAGLGGVTVEAVAARAGVHRATVYRRWPDRADLIRDAVIDSLDAALPIQDTGDLDSDVGALARAVAAILSDPSGAAVTRALVAAAPDDDVVDLVHDYWGRRLSAVERRFRTAVAEGQLPEGTDPARAVQALAAPLFFRLLVTREPLDDADADAAAHDALVLLRRHGA